MLTVITQLSEKCAYLFCGLKAEGNVAALLFYNSHCKTTIPILLIWCFCGNFTLKIYLKIWVAEESNLSYHKNLEKTFVYTIEKNFIHEVPY